MNEYIKQANDFLDKWSLTLSIKYDGKRKHFPHDKEERDCYTFTLTHTVRNRKYSSNFGQSLDGTKKREKPSNYDILTCLTKYDPGTHEDFCSDYGYDTDSIKGLKTYHAVMEEWQGVKKVIPNEAMEEFQNIA